MTIAENRPRPKRVDLPPTEANGYVYGRPEKREPHPLDAVIEKAFEKLPAHTRLYPDIYSWKLTDAVLEAVRKNPELLTLES